MVKQLLFFGFYKSESLIVSQSAMQCFDNEIQEEAIKAIRKTYHYFRRYSSESQNDFGQWKTIKDKHFTYAVLCDYDYDMESSFTMIDEFQSQIEYMKVGLFNDPESYQEELNKIMQQIFQQYATVKINDIQLKINKTDNQHQNKVIQVCPIINYVIIL